MAWRRKSFEIQYYQYILESYFLNLTSLQAHSNSLALLTALTAPLQQPRETVTSCPPLGVSEHFSPPLTAPLQQRRGTVSSPESPSPAVLRWVCRDTSQHPYSTPFSSLEAPSPAALRLVCRHTSHHSYSTLQHPKGTVTSCLALGVSRLTSSCCSREANMGSAATSLEARLYRYSRGGKGGTGVV